LNKPTALILGDLNKGQAKTDGEAKKFCWLGRVDVGATWRRNS
jgi:hypothetical protein